MYSNDIDLEVQKYKVFLNDYKAEFYKIEKSVLFYEAQVQLEKINSNLFIDLIRPNLINIINKTISVLKSHSEVNLSKYYIGSLLYDVFYSIYNLNGIIISSISFDTNSKLSSNLMIELLTQYKEKALISTNVLQIVDILFDFKNSVIEKIK